MLQQTRTETVVPYFERWMADFPTLLDLAQASEQEVLSAWEGLGYYSRARNMHKAAKIVVTDFGGQLPGDLDALRSLPGIGRYTAAAIASIAFGADAAALDGNIRRVLARVFDVDLPVKSLAGDTLLWKLAQDNLPPGKAGDYNQALMDLGATVCLPRGPSCGSCPLNASCLSFQRGNQDQRPVREAKKKIPHYLVTAAVIGRDGRFLIARRPPEGLLGGLWEFPGGKVETGESIPEALQREIREELEVEIEVGEAIGVYRHAYTHFRITLHAFRCRLVAGEPRPIEAAGLAWANPGDLKDFPMGKVDRKIAGQLA